MTIIIVLIAIAIALLLLARPKQPNAAPSSNQRPAAVEYGDDDKRFDIEDNDDETDGADNLLTTEDDEAKADNIEYDEGTVEWHMQKGRLQFNDDDTEVQEIRNRVNEAFERKMRGEPPVLQAPELTDYPLHISFEEERYKALHSSLYSGSYSVSPIDELNCLLPNLYASTIEALEQLTDEIIWYDRQLSKHKVCVVTGHGITPEKQFLLGADNDGLFGCRAVDLGRAGSLQVAERLIVVKTNEDSKQLCVYSNDGHVVGYLSETDSDFLKETLSNGIGFLWVTSVERVIEQGKKQRLASVNIRAGYAHQHFFREQLDRDTLIKPQSISQENPFAGKVVVLSGMFTAIFKHGAQNNAEALLGKYGARVSERLTAEVDLVIVGNKMSDWLERQLENLKRIGMEIPVMSQEELKHIIANYGLTLE